MLPAYLDVGDIKNDLTLYEQLDELEGIALQLVEKIQDTRMLCGSEMVTLTKSLATVLKVLAAVTVEENLLPFEVKPATVAVASLPVAAASIPVEIASATLS